MSIHGQDSNRKLVGRVVESHRAKAGDLIPFEDLLDIAQPRSEDELAEVINADAAEMILHNHPVSPSRYACVIAGRPRARQAAVDAHARSLYELDDLSWDGAQTTAREAVRECAGVGRRRSLSRRRLRLVGGAVAVPVPVVTVIAIGVLLALGCMGQSLHAANLRAQAEYERGEREAKESLTERAVQLYEREQELREREEEFTLRCEERYDELFGAVEAGIASIEKDIEDHHFVDAIEVLRAVEVMAQASINQEPQFIENYRHTRTDGVVMPVLRFIYGDHEELLQVRDILTEINVRPLPQQVDGE